MENSQQEIAARLNDLVDVLRESADNERRFQRDMLDLFAQWELAFGCPAERFYASQTSGASKLYAEICCARSIFLGPL